MLGRLWKAVGAGASSEIHLTSAQQWKTRICPGRFSLLFPGICRWSYSPSLPSHYQLSPVSLEVRTRNRIWSGGSFEPFPRLCCCRWGWPRGQADLQTATNWGKRARPTVPTAAGGLGETPGERSRAAREIKVSLQREGRIRAVLSSLPK